MIAIALHGLLTGSLNACIALIWQIFYAQTISIAA
jgi:hypothetical protein